MFAMVDDAAYERLLGAWMGALSRAGAARADLLHLHHLTPAHEAALRAFPWVPILGQLHGTELAFLRGLRAGPPPAWRYALLGAAVAPLGERLRAADRAPGRRGRGCRPARTRAIAAARASERRRARTLPAATARR